MCLGGKHKVLLDAQLIWFLQPKDGGTTASEELNTHRECLTRFHARRFGFGGTGDHLGPTGEDLTAQG